MKTLRLCIKIGTIIAICLVIGPAHANERADIYEQLELDAITNAKTSAGLGERLSRIDRLRRSDSACVEQLAAGRLPYSCYAAKSVERDLRIQRPLRNHLDEMCEMIARSTNEIEISAASSLPNRCFQLAKARIRVNRYKLGKDFD